MEAVKNTIRAWMNSKGFPVEFQEFFSKWVLLNLYYNEFSNQNREWAKVLEFGRAHEPLFGYLKDEAFKLARTECVGNGLDNASPDSWVKTATLQLRIMLGVDVNSICATCRSTKRNRCQDVNIENYGFGGMEAFMRILYQIRCNLFHGGKTERGSFQRKRNEFLVSVGDDALAVIINRLV